MKRFYCENCGTEVNEDATICPECGAFFVAIKCPRCGYRGKAHEFGKGCPRCGYLGESSTAQENGFSKRTTGKGRHSFDLFSMTGKSGSFRRKNEMPSWVFWLVLATLVTSFVILTIVYSRL